MGIREYSVRLQAWIKSRLPSRDEILPVFSVIVFLVFSWALYRMFYQVPSWLGYLSIWNVLVLATYVLSYALFESLVILGFILFWCFLLPRRFFQDRFVVQGSSLVLALGAGAILIQRKIGVIYELALEELILYPILVLAGIVVFLLLSAWMFSRLEASRQLQIITRLITSLAERMVVFSYLYVPIGLFSWIVILVRNVF